MDVIKGPSEPLVLHGKLTTFRRRCGKPNCHCVDGDRHESPALVVHEGGRTHTITLPAAKVDEVAAALARYDEACGELEAAATAGLADLRARLAARRGPGDEHHRVRGVL